MKNLNLLLLFGVTLIASCSFETGGEAIPADLEGKKALLITKKKALSKLTAEITSLEKEISELDPTAVQKNVALVYSETVERKDFKKFSEIQGAVEGEDMVSATSEIAGRIIQLNAKEGDYIKKGQLVAKIDVEQLNKQIDELNKALELANTVFDRQDRLWKQNIGSEIQFLEAKNNKERLEKNLETLKFQLTKSEVFAPISGSIENVILKNGEVTSPGTPIIQILDTRKLKIKADAPEDYLKSIRMGEKVTVKIPALDLEQIARVSLIGNTIDASNRTFKIEIGLPKVSNLLKPNLLALVMINDYVLENSVVVPVETVLQEVGGKDYVFIVEQGAEQSIAKKVYVETGESYNGEIVIQKGLNGGEQLITEGARYLTNNDPVDSRNEVEETQ